ncbi:MAG: DUF362 domain-containing protein, partial [bacterium]|nr:DUF362 domain-containing protein [bacterium]
MPDRRNEYRTSPPPEPAPEGVSRREFLARVGAAGALAAIAAAGAVALWEPRHFVPGFETPAGLRLPGYAVPAAAGAPALAIAHGMDYDAVVRAAVGALGGIGRFIQKGDVVLLKPNVAFDRPPSLGATTHPETLRAAARLVREAGAARILVADNPINNPVGCFLKSGLTAVA